jgi:hypothetical protein
MSELMNASGCRKNLHWRLLTTVSTLALLGFVVNTPNAAASDDDSDRPVVWIDLGGLLERSDYGADLPTAPFMATVKAPLHSPVAADKPPLFSYGADGSISFQPEESDWIFSASLRYGRSNGRKYIHDQINNRVHDYAPPYFAGGYYTINFGKLVDITAAQNQSHTIADFQAGRDFGLGLFGKNGSSVLSAGVRFAQFSSQATSAVNAKPDTVLYNDIPSRAPKYVAVQRYDVYKFAAFAHHNFRAVGPSISWKASAPFAGNGDGAELTLDWGLNAAFLFGRQKTIVHHRTTGGSFHQRAYPNYAQRYHTSPPTNSRDRTVTVPNLGGFAGLSFRYSNAKVSFGYRGDFFFGALDTGVDTAKRTTMRFYGPFASISVGIGG